MYYTYIHYTADTNEPFYVGKGKDRRAYQSGTKRSKYWHNKVDKHGGFDYEILCEWTDESDAFEHEKLMISVLREMGYTLVNLSDGGDGPSGVKRTEEQKQHLRNLLKGKPRSKETIERIREGTIIGMAKSEKAIATLNNFNKYQTCIHCGKTTTIGNISKHHNDKCKNKE
jgi:hypothetical protein